MSDKSNFSATHSSPLKPRQIKKTKKEVPASTTDPLLPLSELTELVEKLRELGVTEFRQGGLHLSLAHVAPPQPRQEEPAQAQQGTPLKQKPPSVELTDEDLLFWSSEPLSTDKESAE